MAIYANAPPRQFVAQKEILPVALLLLSVSFCMGIGGCLLAARLPVSLVPGFAWGTAILGVLALLPITCDFLMVLLASEQNSDKQDKLWAKSGQYLLLLGFCFGIGVCFTRCYEQLAAAFASSERLSGSQPGAGPVLAIALSAALCFFAASLIRLYGSSWPAVIPGAFCLWLLLGRTLWGMPWITLGIGLVGALIILLGVFAAAFHFSGRLPPALLCILLFATSFLLFGIVAGGVLFVVLLVLNICGHFTGQSTGVPAQAGPAVGVGASAAGWPMAAIAMAMTLHTNPTPDAMIRYKIAVNTPGQPTPHTIWTGEGFMRGDRILIPLNITASAEIATHWDAQQQIAIVEKDGEGLIFKAECPRFIHYKGVNLLDGDPIRLAGAFGRDRQQSTLNEVKTLAGPLPHILPDGQLGIPLRVVCAMVGVDAEKGIRWTRLTPRLSLASAQKLFKSSSADDAEPLDGMVTIDLPPGMTLARLTNKRPEAFSAPARIAQELSGEAQATAR